MKCSQMLINIQPRKTTIVLSISVFLVSWNLGSIFVGLLSHPPWGYLREAFFGRKGQ